MCEQKGIPKFKFQQPLFLNTVMNIFVPAPCCTLYVHFLIDTEIKFLRIEHDQGITMDI